MEVRSLPTSQWMRRLTGIIAPVASVPSSLGHFIGAHIRKLVMACFVVSLVPLPESYYLGTRGEPLFAPISVLLIALAGGLVYVSWWLLVALMWPIGKIARLLSRFVMCTARLYTALANV